MNYQDKIKLVREVMSSFNSNYAEGCVKITEKESELHARVKCQVCHWLKCNQYQCWTEINLKNNKGRADIIALHHSGIAYIFEILVSESEKDLLLKDYPIQIIPVLAKEFNYETFCI